MRKKRSVSTRIANYLFAIIAFVGLITSLSFTMMISNKSDAELINVAGSLRMQAYRLLSEVAKSPQNIESYLQQYQTTLNSTLFINLPKNPFVPNETKVAYQNVLNYWHRMENYIQTQQYLTYQENLSNYIKDLDKFVYALQHFSENKLIIVTATITFSLLLIVCMVAYVIWYTQKQVVKPLKLLALASTQVQMRQFQHVSLDTKRSDELGTLAQVFTQMSAELCNVYSALEKKVSEKTQKLSQVNRSLAMLYYCSQVLAVDVLDRNKLSMVLHSIFANEHLRWLELELYGMEQWNMKLGEIDPNACVVTEKIGLEDRCLGLLHWRAGLPCPDPRMMTNIAQMLGRALYFQQTQRQQQHLVLMEERSIIARELHDSLAQVLSFLQIQLTLLKHTLNKNDEENRVKSLAIIQDFEQALSDGYLQLRELLATFRLTVQEANLKLALEQVITSLQNQTEMQITLDCSLPSQTFSAQDQVHALQIVREAILNAIKHSQGTQIQIIAHTNEDGENEILIQDNGVGIPSLNEPDGHYGLNIMSERSTQLNAKLNITQQQNGGTQVKITLPNILK